MYKSPHLSAVRCLFTLLECATWRRFGYVTIYLTEFGDQSGNFDFDFDFDFDRVLIERVFLELVRSISHELFPVVEPLFRSS